MPVASGQQCIPHVIALLLHFVQGTDGPLMPFGEVCQDHSCQMAKCVNRTPLMGCYGYFWVSGTPPHTHNVICQRAAHARGKGVDGASLTVLP